MSNRLVYVIEADLRVREDLAEQIGHYGYGVSTFASLTEIKKAGAGLPAVIIAALEGLDEMAIMEVQHALDPHPALIFLGATGESELRLRSVRFGGVGYFTKPVNIDALVGLLDNLTAPRTDKAYRVLLVESDGLIAAELDSVLTKAGIVTRLLRNPMQIFPSISEFQPELILMDLYYPEILGMELAAVLRQDPALDRIPIVFQSSEVDPAKQTLALKKGGDDFVLRPVHPEYLLHFLTSRIDRTRMLKSLGHRDGLTGLVNHGAVLDALEMKIELAGLLGKELPFVMIDIDRFKKINDTYGHPVGDMVLKSLGRLLKQRVWSSDLVGRLGGEEFGVVVTSMDASTASRVFNEIRVDFSQIRHHSQLGDFYATFSCGIASYPRYATSRAIEDAAERAVRHVKRMGGNRIGVMR